MLLVNWKQPKLTAVVKIFNTSFHPNLIINMFSMPKCIQSYFLLTWFHQNKCPLKINMLNALQCTMTVFVHQ